MSDLQTIDKKEELEKHEIEWEAWQYNTSILSLLYVFLPTPNLPA